MPHYYIRAALNSRCIDKLFEETNETDFPYLCREYPLPTGL